MKIIETTANQFYRVVEANDPGLAHCWWGIPVRRVKGKWIDKKNRRAVLVRKEGCRPASGSPGPQMLADLINNFGRI
jgi:hypothetical protein